MDNFHNDGFGWQCQRCEQELAKESPPQTRSRLLTEGEAESKTPRFSNPALAKWLDESRRTLICPRCGVVEDVGKN